MKLSRAAQERERSNTAELNDLDEIRLNGETTIEPTKKQGCLRRPKFAHSWIKIVQFLP
jgi:hypothetical protein